MAYRKQYWTPEGKLTASSTRYVKEWRKMAKSLEKALDVRVYAFDPGFGVYDRQGTRTTSIPLWLAKRIVNLPISVPGEFNDK